MALSRKILYHTLIAVFCVAAMVSSISAAPIQAAENTKPEAQLAPPDLSGLWNTETNAHTYLWLEAEDGILTAPMTMLEQLEIPEPQGRNALSHACIITPAEDGKAAAKASFSFSVPKDEYYKFWVRAWMPGTDRDSFLYAIDGSEPKKMATQLNNLTWKSPATLQLTKGEHQLDLLCDKPNVVIDKLLFTTDTNYVPRGLGDPAQRPGAVQKDTMGPSLSAVSLTAKKVGTNKALLEWTPASDETGIQKYKVYLNNRLYTETAGNMTGVAVEGLTPGTSYQIGLKAVDPGGLISRQTAKGSFTTQKSGTAPKAVKRLSAEGGNVRITLRWDIPGDKKTLKYIIYRDGIQIAAADPDAGVYDDIGLAPGTLHDYCVVPVSVSGQTGSMAAVSARVNPYINVKQAPYSAKGDGISDDTAAIQAAFHDWTGKTSFIYIPDGTYLLSHYLEFSDYVKSAKRMMVVGQSQENTVLKWKDNLPLYADRENPRPMLDPYSGPEGLSGDPARDEINYQAFHNSLRHMTLDAGSGNPGAIALRWTNNNTGGLEYVTLRSGDGQGSIGLDLSKQWTGPSYMKSLTIDGFDVGIYGDNDVYNMVFEDLTLKNQRICGIKNRDYPMVIRRMQSENTVPVIINEDSPLETEFDGSVVISHRDTNSLITITDAVFSGGAAETAIENIRGAVFLRNVTAAGYDRLLNDQGTAVDGLYAEEYSTLPPVSAFEDSEKTSLHLPMEDTPTLPIHLVEAADSAEAAYVTDFGAIPGDGLDDTEGIQKAIDSGKKYIILPNGSYHITSTIYVRGNVNAIIGFEAAVNVNGTETEHQFISEEEGIFRICDVNAPFVLCENLSMYGGYLGSPYTFVHATKTPLVMRHIANHMNAAFLCKSYMNTIPGGAVFADDTSMPVWKLDNQTLYARQFNPECRTVEGKVTNIGGNVVILGYKSEGNATEIVSTRGARTEIVGGSIYPASGRPSLYRPAFITEESQLSVNLVEAVGGQDPVRSWHIWFRETQNGKTRDVTEDMLPRRGVVGTAIGLYTGYQTESTIEKLYLDGVEYPYFEYSKLEQIIPVSPDITAPPEISAIAFHENAVLAIEQAGSLGEPAYITVTENGRVQRYTLTFAADHDTALADLCVDRDGKGAKLSTPASLLHFDPEQSAYTFYVTPDESGHFATPQVTAKARSKNAAVSIAQAASVPGTAIVTIVAENGIDTRQYTVSMVPASPSTAQLKSIRVWNNYFLDFDPNRYEYEFSLYEGQLSSVRPGLAAEAQHGFAEVKVTNPDSITGTGAIAVTSADKTNAKTYTIRFSATDNNAKLSAITINGQPMTEFDPDKTAYHLSIPADAELIATAQSDTAAVTVERESQTIRIHVTPAHGLFHKTYTLYTD